MATTYDEPTLRSRGNARPRSGGNAPQNASVKKISNSSRRNEKELQKKRSAILKESREDKRLDRELNAILEGGLDLDTIKGVPLQIREIFDQYHPEAGNFCESIFLFVYGLYRSRSFPDIVVEISHLVKHLFHKNVSYYIGQLVEFAQKTFGSLETDIAELQGGLFGEETVESLHKFFGMSDRISSSVVWKKLQDFIAYVGCFFLQLLPDTEEASTRFKHLRSMVVDRKLEPSGSLVFDICKSLVFLLRQGYQSVKAGSALSFFYTESSLVKWQNDVAAMDIKFANFNSVDESLKSDVSDVIRDLDGLIQRGMEMRLIFKSELEARILSQSMVKLRLKRNELHNGLLAQTMRAAPFALLIHSDPGHGKSSFMSILQNCFADLRGLQRGTHSRYTRNFKEDYWSNFSSTMWCIILDDVANEHTNLLSSVKDSSISEILQIMNNIAYLPNMASLEDKGKTVCNPYLVMATTNQADLNAKHVYAHEYAILRRFPHLISLTVKKEYAKPDGGLDPNKVGHQRLLDIWDILIKTPSKNLEKKASETVYLEKDFIRFTDIVSFLQWYRKAINHHFEVQEKILQNQVDMDNFEFCPTCSGDWKSCEHRLLQAGEEHDPDPDEMLELVSYSWVTEGRKQVAEWIKLDLVWIVFSFLTLYFVPWYSILDVSYILFFLCFSPMSFLFMYRSYSFRWKMVWWLTLTMYRLTPCPLRQRFVRWLGRRAMSRIYRHTAPCFGHIAKVCSLVAALVATGIVVRSYTKKEEKSSLEGALFSSTKDVYYREQEYSVSYDFGRKVPSWKGLPKDKVMSLLEPNVISLRGGQKFGTGICLGGNIVLASYHLFGKVRNFVFHDGVCAREYVLAEDDVVEMESRDLVFLRFRGIPCRKSIIDLFPVDHIRDIECPLMVMKRERSGDMIVDNTGIVKFAGEVIVPPFHVLCYEAQRDSIPGDCGSLYVAWSPRGPVVLGIHQNRKLEYARCIALTKQVLDEGVSKLGPIIQGGSVTRPTLDFPLRELSKDSNLRRIPELPLVLFGSTKARFPSKSKVTKTLIYDHCAERGFVDKYHAPLMRNRKVWINQISPMLQPRKLDLNLLDRAKDMFCHEIVDVLTPEQLSSVVVLSDFDAVNGLDGVCFVNKIPRATSAGFPYNKSKKHFMFIDENQKAHVGDEIMDDVHAIETLYRNGERACPVFMGNLKDEVVTLKKYENAKTRLFTGSPFSFSIVMRKYLLTTVALIENNQALFESYPGCDALGSDWEELYYHLTQFGTDRMCAGDYAAFDKGMPSSAILAAFDILISIAERAGWNQLDIKVIRVMAHDIAFPIANVDGDIFMTDGSNPSGHSLTVIVNCLVNCLYVRMAFINKCPGLSFKEHVALATYGDDNVMGIKKDCEFSHTVLSDFLATQSIKYTMPDKESESIPYVPVSQVTFLKRSFVYDPELKHIVGPLELASSQRSLMYNIPSGSVCEEAQILDSMDTYLREAFFHGKDHHTVERKWILEIASLPRFRDFVKPSQFQSYARLKEWYLGKHGEFSEEDWSEEAEDSPVELQGGYDDAICESDLMDSAVNPICDEENKLDVLTVLKLLPQLAFFYVPYIYFMRAMVREAVKSVPRRERIVCSFFFPFIVGLSVPVLQPYFADFLQMVIGPHCLALIIFFFTILSKRWFKILFLVPWREVSAKFPGLTISGVSEAMVPTNVIPTTTDICGLRLLGGEKRVCLSTPSIVISKHLLGFGITPGDYFCPANQNCSVLDSHKKSEGCGDLFTTRQEWYSPDPELQAGDDHETVEFMDAASPELITKAYESEEISDEMAMDSVSLKDFFMRPVKIGSFTWTESDSTGTITYMYPWRDYFNDARVKYKLNNWAFIKANLKVRIVFNASPFYYGAAMSSYTPLQNFSPGFIHDDSTLKKLIPLSQLPLRAMIYPQHPENVEISIPFFWPANYLRCAEAQDFIDMGKLTFTAITELQSATGITGAGISFAVYAWAEEVVLSGPSVATALQGGDEYADDGPISRPASAIANIAAKFGSVPVIGRFATATQIGATAVSHIAKLFGFTNVPVIEDQKGFHPRSAPPMATTEIGFPIEKLTVDAKNELTIDHRSVGLGPLDELPITHIAQKESYLTQFNWSTSDSEDDLLFNCAVTPQLYDATTDTNQYLYMLPMCWLSTMFNYWRGDIIFRFRIICSQYHKGRLRFSFDPDGTASTNIVDDEVSSNVVMTKVIDIGEQPDVEIRIPYQQYLSWCTNNRATLLTSAARMWGSSYFAHSRGFTNGSFTLRVQTQLSAPVASSTIQVLVFARGAENLDFASPTSVGIENLTSAEIQGGDDVELQAGEDENKGESGTTMVASGKISQPIDHLYLTYMGERIGSLRVLLRRNCKIMTFAPSYSATAYNYVIQSLTLGRIPPPIGWDTSALSTAKGIIDTSTTRKFNFTNGNFLNYVCPAFVGNRGSVNWTANPDAGSAAGIRHFTVVRDKGAIAYATAQPSWDSTTSASNTRNWFVNSRTSGAGCLVADTTVSGTANWQMPFYSGLKFTPTDNHYVNSNSGRSPSNTLDMWSAEWSLSTEYGTPPKASRTHFYAGAGTDFDLLYFRHVPTYGVMNSFPAAV